MPQDHFEGEFAFTLIRGRHEPEQYVWGRCVGTATRREDQCRTWVVVRKGDQPRCRHHQDPEEEPS